MNLPAGEPVETTVTKLVTTVWGAYGTNGLNGDVKHHAEQIGDLYGRDEVLRKEVDERLGAVDDRLNDKLDGLYKLMTTLIVTILVGAGGIIATLVVTSR